VSASSERVGAPGYIRGVGSLRTIPARKADELTKNLTFRHASGTLYVERGDGSDVARGALSLEEQYDLRDQLPERPVVVPPPPPPPDPTPEPPDPTVLDSFKGLADGLPKRYRPYADNSPWNTRATRRFHPDTVEMIANLPWNGRPGNLFVLPDDAKDVQHPIFFARDTDPVYTVVCHESANGHKIQIPDDFKWAKGSDGHGQIVQPNGRSYGCWRITGVDKTKRTITCTYCYWQDYAGLGCVPHGTGAAGSGNGGTTASYFDQDAGIVRAQHLIDGRIEHALFGVVKELAADPPYVWPANKGDQTVAKVLPSMGDRLVLDATESEIRAQPLVAEWEKTTQIAAAEFGILCGDTGGPGLGLMAESKLSPGAWDRWNEYVLAHQIPMVTGYGRMFTSTSGLWKSRLRVQAREA
jgi:hypothetical protein